MREVKKKEVKESRFPISIFLATLVSLLIMAGIHAILVAQISRFNFPLWLPSIIIMSYWILVSFALALYIHRQIKRAYEIPMKRLAKAANAVANGDFSVYISPLHTPNNLDYLDVMIDDFNLMVEELGSIETLKTEFFSNVSHEIKTPLATILSYAQSLKQEDLSDVVKQEYIETIIQSSKRLSQLITNILKLSKLEKQTIQPVYETYDVTRQICDCVLQFETLWDQKDIEIELDLEECRMMESDEDLLSIVWNNLISNAIKFTSPNKKIKISQIYQDENIIVEIIDQGCGMDEITLRHVFDKFYQGDPSHSQEGNGLGLALVMRIIELLEGEIMVNSEVLKGSTFTVRIPIQKRKEVR